MNLDLANLRAFVAVAELGSFHAAADALHLSSPALSRRIALLEDTLKVRLFDRTTRRVSLTMVGRELSHKARLLLNQVESSVLGIRDLTEAWKSEVVIACVPSVLSHFLPAVLLRYQTTFPNIKVRILDEGANGCLARVLKGDAEFGVNFVGAQEADIEFEPILHEPLVLMCRTDDVLSRKRKVTWAELAAYRFIAVAKSSGIRLLLDLALAEAPARPNWSYEVSHVCMLPALVAAGLGVTAVPRLTMPDPQHPQLVTIPLVNPVVTRTLGLIKRRGRSLSPLAEQLYMMTLQARRGMRRSGSISRSSVS